MSDFDTVFKQFKDNTKPMCELMGCPELVEDFIADVEINRQSFKSFYEAGQQSRQAEIDSLQKRIDEALEKCYTGIRKQGGDYYLELVEGILKGDTKQLQREQHLYVVLFSFIRYIVFINYCIQEI